MDARTMTEDAVEQAIGPTLDAFVSKIDPLARRVSEQIYEQFLDTVQDYLRENAQWNIGAEIARCRKIEHDNTMLRIRNQKLERALSNLDRSEILGVAESCASGNPHFDMVSDRIKFARHIISKGTPA